MDVLAHSLWTNIMYKTIPTTRGNKKLTLWGIAFGVLPDLFSFVPIFAYGIYASLFMDKSFFSGAPGSDVPFYNYASESYNYTHSLIIWLAVTLIVWAILKKFPFVLLGWALHIVIDIFSHTDEYFPTPFLFPLSHFKVSIISWGHPVFMAINYALLVILYIFVIPKLKKRNNNNIVPN
jgi:hypothetical protein